MTTLQVNVVEDNENGIYYREWQVTNPKGVVLLVHGVAEHCQRYEAIARVLNEAGYILSALDLPNHGQSEGKRGHIDSNTFFQEAVLTLYERVKSAHSDSPIFILGHSMGGLITSRFLLDHQEKFKGAILSGPAIEVFQEPPAWQVGLIKGIAKLFPALGLGPVDGSMVSRDPEVVKAYNVDPLVYTTKLSAKLLVGFNTTMAEVKSRAGSINLPLLIMHGTADKLTQPSGSQWLYDSIASDDKTLKLYEGLYHEIFNEPEAPSIYKEVVEWLDSH